MRVRPRIAVSLRLTWSDDIPASRAGSRWSPTRTARRGPAASPDSAASTNQRNGTASSGPVSWHHGRATASWARALEVLPALRVSERARDPPARDSQQTVDVECPHLHIRCRLAPRAGEELAVGTEDDPLRAVGDPSAVPRRRASPRLSCSCLRREVASARRVPSRLNSTSSTAAQASTGPHALSGRGVPHERAVAPFRQDLRPVGAPRSRSWRRCSKGLVPDDRGLS